jgi:Tol biopolymer transport system component
VSTRSGLALLCSLVAVIACGAPAAATSVPAAPPAETAPEEPATLPPELVAVPRCQKPDHSRVDASAPQSMVADWRQPVRLGSPINTPCPEDAIEISSDGQALYFLSTADVLDALSPAQMFAPENGTYWAARLGGPTEFGEPARYDLGQGADGSLDGELSFAPDGSRVYFHSLRSTNTGYRQSPPTDDFLDIYVADLVGGLPGPGRNLGAPVNSEFPDGEHAIHPDGVSLYFTSSRPGGLGGNDIWVSTWEGSSWSSPANLGEPINSAGGELQPVFTSDGDTMYFTSDRDPSIGTAIYRSSRAGGTWSPPELVMRGIAGEPSLTADGSTLYFVHVLSDAQGAFDADVWVSARVP